MDDPPGAITRWALRIAGVLLLTPGVVGLGMLVPGVLWSVTMGTPLDIGFLWPSLAVALGWIVSCVVILGGIVEVRQELVRRSSRVVPNRAGPLQAPVPATLHVVAWGIVIAGSVAWWQLSSSLWSFAIGIAGVFAVAAVVDTLRRWVAKRTAAEGVEEDVELVFRGLEPRRADQRNHGRPV